MAHPVSHSLDQFQTCSKPTAQPKSHLLQGALLDCPDMTLRDLSLPFSAGVLPDLSTVQGSSSLPHKDWPVLERDHSGLTKKETQGLTWAPWGQATWPLKPRRPFQGLWLCVPGCPEQRLAGAVNTGLSQDPELAPYGLRQRLCRGAHGRTWLLKSCVWTFQAEAEWRCRAHTLMKIHWEWAGSERRNPAHL